MIIKIIGSIFIAIYYLIYIINYNKKEMEKQKVKKLSITLLFAYIIYLILIWEVIK